MFLLRGNHESASLTKFYGFKGEVDAKYSPVPPDPSIKSASMPLEPLNGVHCAEGAVSTSGGGGSGRGQSAAELLHAASECTQTPPPPPPGVLLAMTKPHPDAKAVYAACKKMFSALPLAAVIQEKTIIMHGGV